MTAGAAQRFGPRQAEDGWTFQLWAPDAAAVSLRLDAAPAMAMRRDAEGFWTARASTQPGALYRFEVDGRLIHDPASRFQPHGVDGPSQLVSPDGYQWRSDRWTTPPWEQTILYEVHAGLMGGFDGVRAALPGIAALGVTAVELMPVSDFAGERNWGYDGVAPFAPAGAYGGPDALRALIDAAHALGLMVFLDVVYNHFGPEGNALAVCAPAFFNPATHTPWGPAIDFKQPAVRRFFIENALYWLESFRIDGLRLDAVHAISDRSWLIDLAGEVRAAFPRRRVHLVVENEANDAALLEAGFDAQWNDDFHNVLHPLLTGETHAYYADFAEAPARKLARCLAQGFIYQGEPSPTHQGRPRGQPSSQLPPTAFVSFLQNHDQIGNRALGERLTVLADPSALRAAMALMLLCPQIPLLFMGEEVGAREPFLFFTDFHGALAEAVRKGRRDEFAAHPGFAEPGERARIPDPNDGATFEASRWSADASDAAAWRALVSELIALRRREIIPRLGAARAIGAEAIGDKAVVARWRLGEATLTLAANLGPAERQADLPNEPPVFGGPAPRHTAPGFTTLAWITG